VPDESTLKMGLVVNLVPVRPEITGTIAHRVLVFAHNVGTGFGLGRVTGQLWRTRIHRADDVGVRTAFGAFVMDGPARLALVNPFGSCLEIWTVARFVTERPDDDGRMVFIALEHAHGAIHVGIGSGRNFRQGPFAIAHAVSLD